MTRDIKIEAGEGNGTPRNKKNETDILTNQKKTAKSENTLGFEFSFLLGQALENVS